MLAREGRSSVLNDDDDGEVPVVNVCLLRGDLPVIDRFGGRDDPPGIEGLLDSAVSSRRRLLDATTDSEGA